LHGDGAAMQLRKTFGQRQPESGPLLLPPVTRVQLMELCEKAVKVFPGDSDSGVADGDLDPRIDPSRADAYTTTGRIELDGVGDQVQEHLLELGRVSDQLEPRFDLDLELDPPRSRQWLDGRPDIVHDPAHIHLPNV